MDAIRFIGAVRYWNPEKGSGLAVADVAREHIAEALQLFAQADDVSGYAVLLNAAAVIAFREGDRLRAAGSRGRIPTAVP